MNFDNVSEVAILGQRSSGAWELNIKDGALGETYSVEVLGSDWLDKPNLLLIENSSESKVLVYGNTTSGSEVKLILN